MFSQDAELESRFQELILEKKELDREREEMRREREELVKLENKIKDDVINNKARRCSNTELKKFNKYINAYMASV